MNGMTIGEMLRACRGEWQGTEETLTKAPSSIVTDSRQAGEGSLFLALRGEKTDGHKYIPDVLQKGALAVLCEERGAAGEPRIVVPDTLAAMQQIAAASRKRWNIPFIGVTGSVGKTTTKEMIASVVSQRYRTLKTAENFNNDIGTPLTLLGLDDTYEAAVIETGLPIALHLDHGDSFELCKSCIEDGFTSVMIDASSKPFAENIALTRQVVEYAHDHGVVVEAELGTLAGIEDEVNVSAEDSSYTHPEEVEEFVSRTGCDSLAIAIGTSHGAYKFKPGTKPQLRFDVLEEVSRRLPGFPIVLHGSSSVPQDLVAKVNQYGGNMPGAIGVPEDQLRKATSLSVCKINIDSDLRLAMTASIREHFALHPADFDPRQYLKPARQAIKELVAHKIVDVLGCDGKAF